MQMRSDSPVLGWARFGGLDADRTSVTACQLVGLIVIGLGRFFFLIGVGVFVGIVALVEPGVALLVWFQTGYVEQHVLILTVVLLSMVGILGAGFLAAFVWISAPGSLRNRLAAAYDSVRNRWCARIQIVEPPPSGDY